MDKTTTQKGPPKGSRNAAKGEEDMTSKLIIRCTPREKAGWVKQAQSGNLKLAEWVRGKLNNPAE